MSADQQRLNSAIQRIAEQSPRLRSLLDANDNKGGKPGSAGVGVSEAEETRICCDGSTSSNANPGTSERDPTDGDQDGLNPDDPADLSGLDGGCLRGVTNCDTGDPICFCGDDFIPPDGWDAPDEPPPDPEWEADDQVYWEYFAADVKARTKGQIKQIIVDNINSGGTYNFCSWAVDTANEVHAFRDFSDPCVNFFLDSSNALRRTCDTNFDEVWCGTDFGNPDQPYDTDQQWPEDGCTNLAIVNGSIVGSKYDPENDGSYSAPVQELEVCDAVTGDPILLRVDTNSTYKSIKSLSGDIDPDTQAGYLYDTNTGQRIRQISPSEFRDPTV